MTDDGRRMGRWQEGHPIVKKGIHNSKIYELVEKLNLALL